MESVPNEVLELIFDYVLWDKFKPLNEKERKVVALFNFKKLLRLGKVCKQWRYVASFNHFWKPICYDIFWKPDGKLDHRINLWCDFRHRNGAVRKYTMPIEDWLLFEQNNICRFFVSKRIAEIRPDYQYYNVPPYYYNKDVVKNRKPIENSSAALRSHVWVNNENKETVGKYCRQKKHFNLGFKQYKTLLQWQGEYFDYFIKYYEQAHNKK